jgi:hypothetical protein
VGAKFARRRQRGGVVLRTYRLVNTLFSFFFLSGISSNQTEIRKPEIKKLAFDFRGLLLCLPPFGAALFSDERVIGATFRPVTPLDDKNDIFSGGAETACGKLDQITSD